MFYFCRIFWFSRVRSSSVVYTFHVGSSSTLTSPIKGSGLDRLGTQSHCSSDHWSFWGVVSSLPDVTRSSPRGSVTLEEFQTPQRSVLTNPLPKDMGLVCV